MSIPPSISTFKAVAPSTVPVSPGRRACPHASSRGADSGEYMGLDLRLHRRVADPVSAGAFSSTAAGFRMPIRSLRELAVRILEHADAMKAS